MNAYISSDTQPSAAYLWVSFVKPNKLRMLLLLRYSPRQLKISPDDSMEQYILHETSGFGSYTADKVFSYFMTL